MGNTWPFLVAWMLILPISIVSKIVFNIPVNLELVIKITGICSLVYMGFEYSTDFLKNKSLPKGVGSVEGLRRYKWIVNIWLLYSVAVVIIGSVLASVGDEYLVVDSDTTNTIIFWAGTITIEYLAGNKSNGLATKSLGVDTSSDEVSNTDIDELPVVTDASDDINLDK